MRPEANAKTAPGYKTSGPLLYVSNCTNSNVTVYHAGAKDPAPIVTISNSLNGPAGDCVDSKGTLYVMNEPANGPGWISEYALGKTKAFKFITKGVSTPAFCTIDSMDNLWVSNIGGPNVTEYLYGSKAPHTVITKDMVYPVGVAIDHSGNLYVANRLGYSDSYIAVYASGSKTPTRTITYGGMYPLEFVRTKKTLYVPNTTANNVKNTFRGHGDPDRKITHALSGPVAVVANAKGWLYVANDVNSDNVVEYAPNSTMPSKRRISKGLSVPIGVAHYPPLLP